MSEQPDYNSNGAANPKGDAAYWRDRAEKAEQENSRLMDAILEGAAAAAVEIHIGLLKSGLIESDDKRIGSAIGKSIVAKILEKAQEKRSGGIEQ